MAHLNYDDLAQRAIEGGFTVDLDGNSPTTGYVVGSRPDRTLIVDLRRSTLRDVADDIYSYVVDNGYELRNGYLLGAWTDDGKLYLDLVQVFPDQGSAMALARALGEIAVYNLGSRETIPTAEPPQWVDTYPYEHVHHGWMDRFTYPYEHSHYGRPRTNWRSDEELDRRRDVELDDWHGQYDDDDG